MPARTLALLSLALALAPALAGDWASWRGPRRDGLSEETGLLKEWPKDGPKLLWKSKGIGGGFGSPSLVGGKIYLVGTKGESTEHLFCLDATDEGKLLWSIEIGSTDGGHPAPRCTPTIADGRAYVLSSNGKLHCLDLEKKGASVWAKDLRKDYGGKTGSWAYAESPLLDGDVLVCTPGGEKATLLALKAKDGAEVWKSSVTGLTAKEGKKGKRDYNTAGYSSAIVAEVAGVKQYVQFLTGGVVGIGAKDGNLLWHYDEPASTSANCSTPLFQGGAVFAASGYSNGGGRATVTEKDGKFTAKQDYFIPELTNHHGNMVLVGKHVYGCSNDGLMCVEFATGKIAWHQRRGGAGKGSVIYAEGHIYHRGENGEMALVEANPEKYVEKARFTQPDRGKERAWASPIVADGKLYLRDWDVLLCYDIKAK